MALKHTVEAIRGLIDNVERVITGKRDAVTLAAVALFADQHLLIEDVPGVGKTMLARAIARSIGGTFKRVQGTPDLLPADVTGATVWNQGTGRFEFVPGPVFANVLLVDEINRATPKTQSALLEVMEERRVTADGVPYELPKPFFVIATLNPVEHHGTFPLPEGELDRFGMSITLGYPDPAAERRIVLQQMDHHPIDDLAPVLSPQDLAAHRAAVRAVHLEESVLEYALAVVRATRQHPDLELGASPRGSLALTRCAQALALARGRDYVLPDDVKACALPVLAHRVLVASERRLGAGAARSAVAGLLTEVPVPVAAAQRRP